MSKLVHYSNLLKKLYKVNKVLFFIFYQPYRIINHWYGSSIAFNSNIGNNLKLPHSYFGIFISGDAKIGNNCTIYHHVTIGSNYDSDKGGGHQ